MALELAQFPEKVRSRIRRNGPQWAGKPEVVAVACSNLTGPAWDGMVAVVDVASKNVEYAIPTYGGNTSVAWLGNSPNSLLMHGGDDGAVYIWKLPDEPNSVEQKENSEDPSSSSSSTSMEKRSNKRKAKATKSPVKAESALAPSASSSSSSTVAPVESVVEVSSPQMTGNLYNHSDTVTSINPLFDNSLVLTSSWDASLNVFDVQTSMATTTCFEPDQVLTSQWVPDSSTEFLAAVRDGSVSLWDTRAKRRARSVKAISSFASPRDAVYSISWRTDTEFVVGCESGSIYLFDVRSLGGQKHSGSSGPWLAGETRRVAPVWDVEVCPENRDLIAVGGDDTTMRVLRMHSLGSPSPLMETVLSVSHSDYVRGVEWSRTAPASVFTTSWDLSLALHACPPLAIPMPDSP